jgi:methionyl-tRNA synthetase
VPIPWDPDQVAYVWADALVNYRSALSYAPGENLERFWPATHLLAKDILRFHCVYWPALLLSAGEEPTKQLFVHGYLNFDSRKMSKSLGNVINPFELIDVYGVDAVRYDAARATNFGQDGNVSVDDVRERYERELGNDLGNLVSRTTAMIARYRDGALEQAGGEAPWDVAALRDKLVDLLDRFEITAALDEIWQLVRRLNQYVEETAPWQLAKDDARADELTAVLYHLADGLTAVAIAVAAYLPESAPRILEALGQDADDLSLDRVKPRTATAASGIAPAAPLFPRIELPAAAP